MSSEPEYLEDLDPDNESVINLMFGTAVARRVGQFLGGRLSDEAFFAVSIAVKEVLTVVESSDNPFHALDEWHKLNEMLEVSQ